LRIGQLTEHATNAAQVGRMLAAAQRNIADARQSSISPETRLDAAYRAIMQLAMVALWVSGFRPVKQVPGHHQLMIQSLVHSIGLESGKARVLDTFRVKRNAIDYTGEDVDTASVAACIEAADELLVAVRAWLASFRPELLV
jgi:hypothetical protein